MKKQKGRFCNKHIKKEEEDIILCYYSNCKNKVKYIKELCHKHRLYDNIFPFSNLYIKSIKNMEFNSSLNYKNKRKKNYEMEIKNSNPLKIPLPEPDYNEFISLNNEYRNTEIIKLIIPNCIYRILYKNNIFKINYDLLFYKKRLNKGIYNNFPPNIIYKKKSWKSLLNGIKDYIFTDKDIFENNIYNFIYKLLNVLKNRYEILHIDILDIINKFIKYNNIELSSDYLDYINILNKEFDDDKSLISNFYNSSYSCNYCRNKYYSDYDDFKYEKGIQTNKIILSNNKLDSINIYPFTNKNNKSYKINIKTHRNSYISIYKEKVFQNYIENPGINEEIEIIYLEDDNVVFKVGENKFISTIFDNINSKFYILNISNIITETCKFKLINRNNKCAIYSSKYNLYINSQQKINIKVSSKYINKAELFEIEKVKY
jgi:hypothetical protein